MTSRLKGEAQGYVQGIKFETENFKTKGEGFEFRFKHALQVNY